MGVGLRHEGAERGEVLVHLAAAVALDGNVGHPLALGVLAVLAAPRPPPPLPPRRRGRRRVAGARRGKLGDLAGNC